MFIRRTKTRPTDQGESYYSHRLVDTSRVGDRVRQRTLLNLGSGFSSAPEHWKTLTQRIEHIVLGQHDLLPTPITPEVEREAQQIAASLLSKYNNAVLKLSPRKTTARTPVKPATASIDRSSADDRDMRRVDLDSLVMMNSRCVGAEAVALSALRQARLDKKLQALGFNPKQLHAAIGNIIGRMIRPGSELLTHRWLHEQSALGELLGGDLAPSLTALYRASDLLWKHHDAIETFLYQQHCALFDVAETITLFDLTNTFLEGTGQYNDHAAYGHSKEKRSDCPLVTLALVLDGSGFSRRSRIFPGNVSEPGTLQQMIDTLLTPQDAQPTPDVDAGASTSKHTDTRQQALDFGSLPTIIMDAGTATEENVTWLKQQGYPYLVVSRKRHLVFDENQAVTVKTGADDAVRAVRMEREDGEIELYCHSQGREAKARAIGQRFSTRFEHELQHLAEGLDKPRRLKSAHKVCEKIGRLRQKYARAAKHYEIKTELDASGKKAVA